MQLETIISSKCCWCSICLSSPIGHLSTSSLPSKFGSFNIFNIWICFLKEGCKVPALRELWLTLDIILKEEFRRSEWTKTAWNYSCYWCWQEGKWTMDKDPLVRNASGGRSFVVYYVFLLNGSLLLLVVVLQATFLIIGAANFNHQVKSSSSLEP